MNNEKNMTWADLKKIVNKMPESRLKDDVTIWTDTEECFKVADIEILKEDYVFDGDEGCAPKSVMKVADPKDWKENRDEYYTVHQKGTRIINAGS
jgi:hypothetical protein